MGSSEAVFHEASIEGGKHWSLTVRSGTVLRLDRRERRRERRNALLQPATTSSNATTRRTR